jgi:tRNA modification GTPase
MIGDTIFAIASPPGAGSRGILRLSGPDARAMADRVLAAPCPSRRGATETTVTVLGHRVSCLVLTMPAPHSYTGEDVVELHLPGSPVLLDEVCRAFPPMGRLATPGEFTRRAFEAGRMDLAAAEAVPFLIHAADVDESRFALDVLRGGLATSVDAIRGAIQDALALLEAGLDFTDGETGAVSSDQWLPSLAAARSQCGQLLAGLPPTGVHGEVLLLGAANAGKSSLVNALSADSLTGAKGEAASVAPRQAMVAAVAGTTRDVLAFELAPGLTLLDGPGDLPDSAAAAKDASALALRDRIAERVAGVLEVVDVTAPRFPAAAAAPVVARVFTKIDLHTPPASPTGTIPTFPVSNVTGAGVPALREFLLRSAGSGHHGLRTRVHDALGSVPVALDRAMALAAAGQPDELIALELGIALAALDRIHGRSSPEDLLDRIFAGFCLGK